jgi:hypothetical protein
MAFGSELSSIISLRNNRLLLKKSLKKVDKKLLAKRRRLAKRIELPGSNSSFEERMEIRRRVRRELLNEKIIGYTITAIITLIILVLTLTIFKSCRSETTSSGSKQEVVQQFYEQKKHQPRLEDYMASGFTYYKRGEFNNALYQFNLVLRYDSTNNLALRGRRLVYEHFCDSIGIYCNEI